MNAKWVCKRQDRARSKVLAFACLALGGACGGATATSTANTASTTAPSATSAPSASASIAVAPDASAPCILEEIHARLAFVPPTAPHEAAGTLTVDCKNHTCSVEARDTSGKSTSSASAISDATATLSPVIVHAACSLGGESFYVLKEPADESHVELQVARYTKHDEAADLARICAPLSSFTDKGKPIDTTSFDASQRPFIRAMVLEPELTSRRWRVWLRDLVKPEQRDEQVAVLRKAIADAGIASCAAEWLTARSP
jgi:hypothetical protein